MKQLYHYISAIAALLLSSCAGSVDEPTRAIEWPEGEVPLGMHARNERGQSRADVTWLDGQQYDLYLLAGYYNSPLCYGYYTADEGNPNLFRKMIYQPAEDENPDYFYVSDRFFPLDGDMDMIAYGVPTGKNINAAGLPDRTEMGIDTRIDYMTLKLDDSYDGSFEVIACDPMSVHCQSGLLISNLPTAVFHHLQAHINFVMMWEGTAGYANISNRIKVNSITIEDTPMRGIYYLANNAPQSYWGPLLDNKGNELPYEDARINVGGATIPTRNKDANAKLEAGGVYVIPQQRRHRIIVNYTLLIGNLNNNPEERCMNYVVSDPNANDVDADWKAGYDYTYILVMGKSGNITIENLVVQPFAQGHVGNTEID